MASKTDLELLRAKSAADIDWLTKRFKEFDDTLPERKYHLLRWAAEMSIVELHAIWEKFAEERLVIALNHNPAFFISDNSIRGTEKITKGLAHVLVKGNQKYFDFRSMEDLVKRATKLLGPSSNPFKTLDRNTQVKYLDALSAIRNCIAHRSEASLVAYKRSLKETFSIKSAPSPAEFLNAKDNRQISPLKWEKRIYVIAKVVMTVVKTV